jgi:hypothetical protein
LPDQLENYAPVPQLLVLLNFRLTPMPDSYENFVPHVVFQSGLAIEIRKLRIRILIEKKNCIYRMSLELSVLMPFKIAEFRKRKM